MTDEATHNPFSIHKYSILFKIKVTAGLKPHAQPILLRARILALEAEIIPTYPSGMDMTEANQGVYLWN